MTPGPLKDSSLTDKVSANCCTLTRWTPTAGSASTDNGHARKRISLPSSQRIPSPPRRNQLQPIKASPRLGVAVKLTTSGLARGEVPRRGKEPPLSADLPRLHPRNVPAPENPPNPRTAFPALPSVPCRSSFRIRLKYPPQSSSPRTHAPAPVVADEPPEVMTAAADDEPGNLKAKHKRTRTGCMKCRVRRRKCKPARLRHHHSFLSCPC
jgi:hypothetical protein